MNIIALFLVAIPVAIVVIGFRVIFKPHKKVVRFLAQQPIVLYAGHNGAGKTWLATQVRSATLQNPTWECYNPKHPHSKRGIFKGTRRVLSTVRLTDPNAKLDQDGLRADHPFYTRWHHAAQITDPSLEHTDVFCDEAVLHGLDGRQAMSMPVAYRRLLQQLRKHDLTFHATIPAIDFVDKTLRVMATHYVETRGFAPKMVKGSIWPQRRLFLVKIYNAREYSQWTDGARKEAKPMMRCWIWRPGKIADRLYDSSEMVEPVAGFDELGKCSACGGKPVEKRCKCENPLLGYQALDQMHADISDLVSSDAPAAEAETAEPADHSCEGAQGA